MCVVVSCFMRCCERVRVSWFVYVSVVCFVIDMCFPFVLLCVCCCVFYCERVACLFCVLVDVLCVLCHRLYCVCVFDGLSCWSSFVRVCVCSLLV